MKENWQVLPEETIFKEIARNLKELRKSYQFSQEKLAELTDLSPRTIQRIESGKSLNLGTVIRVYRAYGKLNDLQKVFERTRKVSPMEMLKKLKESNR